MRAVLVTAALLLAGCGATGGAVTVRTAAPSSVAVGGEVYSLDQLAAAPNDGSGAHLLYAVVRVTTTDPQHIERDAFFTLVDDAGTRYSPIAATVYVPVDHLDGLVISPGHAGAGVVAFAAPRAAPRSVVVSDNGQTGVLSAP